MASVELIIVSDFLINKLKVKKDMKKFYFELADTSKIIVEIEELQMRVFLNNLMLMKTDHSRLGSLFRYSKLHSHKQE